MSFWMNWNKGTQTDTSLHSHVDDFIATLIPDSTSDRRRRKGGWGKGRRTEEVEGEGIGKKQENGGWEGGGRIRCTVRLSNYQQLLQCISVPLPPQWFKHSSTIVGPHPLQRGHHDSWILQDCGGLPQGQPHS